MKKLPTKTDILLDFEKELITVKLTLDQFKIVSRIICCGESRNKYFLSSLTPILIN